MTTYTSTMLANEALSVLMADGGSGQSPAAEDTQKVSGKLEAFFAELSARCGIEVPDTDDIDAGLFRGLAELLANYCASDFGKPSLSYGQRIEIEDRLLTVINRGALGKLKVDQALRCGPRGISLASWRSGFR